MATCARCAGACDALKRTVSLCRRLPVRLDLHAGRLIDLGAHVRAELLCELRARLDAVSAVDDTGELGPERHPWPGAAGS